MKNLYKKFNIKPKDELLYKQAFSHTSYAYEMGKEYVSYERLEFLGDAILDAVLSEYLYLNTKDEEGKMTKTRASYVCENALYQYALDYELYKYIKLGHGEEEDNGRLKKVILADVFEAFIGAMYLDLGYEKTKEVILDVIVPYIKDPKVIFFNDYKSAIQEYMQTDDKTIKYVLINESGPAHNKRFTINLLVDDIVLGTGISNSKKEAEQEAAKDSISKMANIDKS